MAVWMTFDFKIIKRAIKVNPSDDNKRKCFIDFATMTKEEVQQRKFDVISFYELSYIY